MITAGTSRPTLVNKPVDRACLLPDISHDGQVVTFQSQAGNPKHDLATDIYLNDSGTVEAVTQGDNLSRNASLSADGRFVAFSSRSRNLSEQPTRWEQIYLHDRQTGETRCLTPGADDNCTDPQISADGRTITFTSRAKLLPEEGEGRLRNQVYVVDTQSGRVGTRQRDFVRRGGQPYLGSAHHLGRRSPGGVPFSGRQPGKRVTTIGSPTSFSKIAEPGPSPVSPRALTWAPATR